jgi:hypothetical protein
VGVVRLKVVGSAPFYVDPSWQSVYPTGQHFGMLTETGATDCYYTFQQPTIRSAKLAPLLYTGYIYTPISKSALKNQCRP